MNIMSMKIWPSIAFLSMAAFFMALGFAYCAGYWAYLSFLGAELIGFLVAFLGAAILLVFFKVNGRLRKLAVFFVSLS